MDSVIAPLTPTHGLIFSLFFAFLSSTDSRLFNGYAIPFLGMICDVGHRADVSVRYKRRCTDSRLVFRSESVVRSCRKIICSLYFFISISFDLICRLILICELSTRVTCKKKHKFAFLFFLFFPFFLFKPSKRKVSLL